jgi:type II secretory pathway component PulL
MDFATKGYSLQEGEGRLLASGITDQLIQHSRIRLVERAILDRLLEELRLGTSNLVDRGTALSLGKILAARLMLSGQLVYSGPITQVSLRLIETETGRVTAALNESFGSTVPASALTEKVSALLLSKLNKLYPLRGKISEVKGEEIALNIGQKAGVEIGQQFKVIDEDVTLKVTSVQSDTSLSKIDEGKGKPATEMRVEGLIEGEHN